jgi:integrase
MRKHHPKNERIKRKYLAYLQEAKRLSVSSADQAAAAIATFEESTRWRDFALFHIEQARSFKSRTAAQTNCETGKPLAKATIHSRLLALKAFFQWLSEQPGYRKISYSDAEYFNPSANDSRIATAKREKPAPSVDQIRHVLCATAVDSDIDRRDRALIAFALLSGARDDAIASLSLRHVDTALRTVFHDARSVRTKNRKTFTSWFFPVGENVEEIVVEWIAFLKSDLLFGPDEPLFPATLVTLNGDGLFAPAGLDRKFWRSADAIRRIFRQRFETAGLPYFKPHSFRTTLARLGSVICPTQEAWSAWCENLGHEDAITTFRSYANVPTHRRADIFEALRHPARPLDAGKGPPDNETIQRVLDHLRKSAA